MSKKRSKRATKSTGPKSPSQPSDLSDAVPFDRRAMESLMQQLVPGPAVTNSRVNAAQQVMYQAFEATSPRQQMMLAGKAARNLAGLCGRLRRVSRICRDASRRLGVI